MTPDATVFLRKMSAYRREGHDALLNSGATGVVQAYDRRSHLHSEIHNLADLLRVGFAERSAENSEVLREYIDQAPINTAVPGNHAVAGIFLILHSEIETTVTDKFVDFFERVFIEEKQNALSSREFAFGLLAFQALLAASQFSGAV